MSQNDDFTTALLAIGAIGLGVAGAAALSSWETKRQFREDFTRAIGEYGVGVVNLELGKSDQGGPSWVVTLNHPWAGLLSYQVDFPQGTSPYAKATRVEAVQRLVRAMPTVARSMV